MTTASAVDAAAARIEALDGRIGAFTTLCLERARAEAARPVTGPLAGVPFAAKDLYDTEGVRTTYGSGMFAEYVPAADAEAVRRLRAAGAILVGKAQMFEFAWGISSANDQVGSSRNPWDRARDAGGSSGGAAAAVAAGMVPFALASDTGGSIRIPAAFCGAIGFKPTHGLIPLDGAWPLAPSLDHAGLIAQTPEDVRLALQVLTGRTFARGRVAGLRIGICEDLHLAPLVPAVQHAWLQAVALFEELGATVTETSFPETELVMPTFGATQRAEALDAHERAGLWPSRAAEYGPGVAARLEQARGETLASYIAAARERQRLQRRCAELFDAVDVLLTPALPCTAPPLGAASVQHDGVERELRELVMPFTVLQDLAGLPAAVVRAGFDELPLPVAIQLTGPRGADERVLAGVREFYDATPELQGRRPPVGD